ncbi:MULTISPECIES: superinfection immunity protein [Acetobacter]|uniref:superinfection immunity protein n=1 Tax=Acetobacter TaxID=434 RepID=UPI00111C9D84|nr:MULTISPECIES: superinfection immunity protein [Acetobacter]
MKRVLLLAAVLAAPGVAWGQDYKPDFNCSADHSKDSIATMLCQNSEAAKHELIFDQTYYALRQIVGKAGWKSLKQEVIADDGALKECVAPFSAEGVLQQTDPGCYIQKMDAITEKYKGRLSGSALEEASRPIDDHIALQKKLLTLGYLPAGSTADGVYGESTRQAIGAWKLNSGIPQVDDFISNSDAVSLASSDKVAKTEPKYSPFQKEVNVNGTIFKVAANCDSQENSCSNMSLTIKEGKKTTTLQLKSLDDLGTPDLSFDKPIFGSEDAVVYGSVYTGGAHCCVDSLLVFKNENKEWSVASLPEQDGGPSGGSPYKDLAGDGHHEIAVNDMRFDYKFDCYACSFPPMQIFEIRNNHLEDVSGDKRFHPFLEKEVQNAESSLVRGGPNMGFYAGITAIKAQEGNFLSYWDEKIKRNPDFNNLSSIDYCDAAGLPQKKCPPNGSDPLKFPNALAVFLYKTGYIDQYDLKYTGYSVREIDKSEYDRTHPINFFKYYIKIGIYKISTLHSYAPSLSDGIFYSVVFSVLFLIFLSFAFYFLPIFIAAKTKSQHFWLIVFVNVFFGWTFLGWLAALLMALMMDRDRQA